MNPPAQKRITAAICLLILILTGCSGTGQTVRYSNAPTSTSTGKPIPTSIDATPGSSYVITKTTPEEATPAFSATPTLPKPTSTVTPIPSPTLMPTATRDWIWNAAGSATAPILLYHHVAENGGTSPYYVTMGVFQQHMDILKHNEYTPISMATLVDALVKGADLPLRPVIITFDDCNEDVYTNAFPILKKMGFTATMYIIFDRLGDKDSLTIDQTRELVNAGWEIGSHSNTHPDLRSVRTTLDAEIGGSRKELEKLLNTSVSSFAYPYGYTDDVVFKKVKAYGYTSGVGLGGLSQHNSNQQYYLSRIPVLSTMTMADFSKRLPWYDPDYLPDLPKTQG
jgi:peptidoglycan/xylan/chitin deacetylase (PgdA/CDA1 family)